MAPADPIFLFAAVQFAYAAHPFSLTRVITTGKPLRRRIFNDIYAQPHETSPEIHSRQPVSIIICAKNEAANLQKNLPAVLAQRYTNDAGEGLYEVIVVDDGSVDDTVAVLTSLKASYPNLKIVHTNTDNERQFPGKKKALSRGVAAASNEWLLLTDADCIPQSDEWLALMAGQLAAGKEIVAGYGGFDNAGGSLNTFIRWETMHTFYQYSAFAFAGNPYMAVGRNLACTREVMEKAQASDLWLQTPSGDDDLLVRLQGTRDNMVIVSDSRAFTRSQASTSWRDWAGRKQRHLSTGKHYKPFIKTLLATYGISHAGIWIMFFLAAATGRWFLCAWVLAQRVALYWLPWSRMARKLGEKKLVVYFPLCDLGWMMYNFAFLPYIAWKNKRTWT